MPLDDGDKCASQGKVHKRRKLNYLASARFQSVCALVPESQKGVPLTKKQRLGQLLKYTVFLETTVGQLVKELGVQLNFDHNPVSRHASHMRYIVRRPECVRPGETQLPDDFRQEIHKLLESIEPVGSVEEPRLHPPAPGLYIMTNSAAVGQPDLPPHSS